MQHIGARDFAALLVGDGATQPASSRPLLLDVREPWEF